MANDPFNDGAVSSQYPLTGPRDFRNLPIAGAPDPGHPNRTNTNHILKQSWEYLNLMTDIRNEMLVLKNELLLLYDITEIGDIIYAGDIASYPARP